MEKYIIEELNDDEVDYIENQLEKHDKEYIKYKLNGDIRIGIKKQGEIIASLDATMTAFKILYVSSVFVEQNYRRQGIGRVLMMELERQAIELGANMIRLDTFDFQGREFYKAIGYDEIGHYQNEVDCFSESFFLKKLY